MQKWLCVLALVASLAALSLSAWTYREADARAEAAVRRREKALVDEQRPRVERLCHEFGLPDPPPDAQTLDELYRPLGGLLDGLHK
jgi:hypothetical protein